MFHLNFQIPEAEHKIRLTDRLVLIGSCFADTMGDKLAAHKFKTLSNPFGTIYNPVSLAGLLLDHVDNSATIQSQGVWFHWQAHGEVSALSEGELNKKMTNSRTRLQASLSEAQWLVLTLGSSFAYRLKSSGEVVANCHKMPSSLFTKELLAIDTMRHHLSRAFGLLFEKNNHLKIILTVSPVRHIRDGLVENNRSKAQLIELAHTLCDQFAAVRYFPAYEILLDELRDYRFFAADRVHPSAEATDYIWQKFTETFMGPEERAFVKEWQSVLQAMNHRPFHPQAENHQQFLRSTIARLQRLADKVDVSVEVSLLERQLLSPG